MPEPDVAASLPSPSSNGFSNGTPAQTPSPISDTPYNFNPTRRQSSSRALIPTPLAVSVASLTPKAAIATASSPPHEYAYPSPAGGGPTSASYVVPPRPKPGRKPATDEPASKRKAQNRESQRAFRARKAAKVSELQAQVDSVEQRHRQEVSDKIAELNVKDLQIRRLEALVAQLKETEKRTAQERDFWKDQSARDQAQAQMLERQLEETGGSIAFTERPFFQAGPPSSRQGSPSIEPVTTFPTMDLGCGNCRANGECQCMEDMATFADREIDFTAQFSTKRQHADTRPSIAFITQASNEADSRCGFCTDELNCLCKDESLLTLHDMQRNHDKMPAPSHAWSGAAPDDTKSSQTDCPTTGPGTCADCQSNPRQRVWCQRLAQLKSSSPSSRNSSVGSPLDAVETRVDNATVPDSNMTRYSIGCGDAFKLLEGRVPMEHDQMDWISNLKPISPTRMRRDTLPTMEPVRKYSALELDTASVIATLQQSMMPIVARDSDGENVRLVRIAQERQQSSDSPR